MYELRHYQTVDGRNYFAEWFGALDVKAKARIARRLNRMASGAMGDCKSVGGGVSEAREMFGPGYRVYFSRVGDVLLLLLCGGDKSTQKKDIQRAKSYFQDYKTRAK